MPTETPSRLDLGEVELDCYLTASEDAEEAGYGEILLSLTAADDGAIHVSIDEEGRSEVWSRSPPITPAEMREMADWLEEAAATIEADEVDA